MIARVCRWILVVTFMLAAVSCVTPDGPGIGLFTKIRGPVGVVGQSSSSSSSKVGKSVSHSMLGLFTEYTTLVYGE